MKGEWKKEECVHGMGRRIRKVALMDGILVVQVKV